MLTRIIKTTLLAALGYYAVRKAAAHTKLLAIRAEAKNEMDHLQKVLHDIYDEGNSFDLSTMEKKIKFDDTLKQFTKWTRIYDKTF
jgi:hypothetical protein